MARIATIVVIITLISLSTGCRLDTMGSRMPPSTTTVYGPPRNIDMTNTSVADLAEQIALTRQEYLQTLEILEDMFARMGDSHNQRLAQRELSALKKVPMIDYLGDVIPGPELRARIVSAEADTLYKEAKDTYDQAVKIVVWKKKGELVLAADKFKQVIRYHPSSDKIDDAAFFLGVIYENLKNYQLAFNYYQRAFQWDSGTPHPARFKAAFVLDEYLHDKDKALELYQVAVTSDGTRHPAWKEHAQERIQKLTGTAK